MDLSLEQQYAFDRFKRGENIFMTGQGGTGKTRLIEKFVEHCICNNTAFQVCALTGCATILLPDVCKARTIHSWSGIKLCKGDNKRIVSNALKNRAVKSGWRKVRVLIVDEVSMMSVKMLEVLDAIARKSRSNEYLPFGGIQVVFVGDFYQLPPVGTIGDPTTEQFCFESELWSKIIPQKNHIELKTVFRQTDVKFKEILSQIRTATLTDSNIKILDGYVKREYNPEKYNGCVPPKLYPTRAKADYLNNLRYSQLEGQEYVYEYKRREFDENDKKSGESDSKAIKVKECISREEFEYECDQLMNTSSFQEVLELKVGAVVMCTVNLDMDNGICNGSQGIITSIDETALGNYPVVKFTNGVERTITPHYIQSEEYPSVSVGQVPLCLAWAMTIHKIQGATLAMASIDVGGQIFEYGQTYVALSRVQSLDGLYLSAFNSYKIRANEGVNRFYASLPKLEYKIEDDPFEKFAYKEDELREEEYVDPNIKRVRL